jgi:multimeric flavodoxin WrbA
MGKKVMIAIGSPRKKGNSATLAQQVAAGAKADGARVETFFHHEYQALHGDACRKKGWIASFRTTCRCFTPSCEMRMLS